MKQRHPKNVVLGTPARKGLLAGALTLADTVAVTYGPHGRTVLLDRAAGLLTTKDGVTVAREVGLEDPVQELGCKILRQACIKTNDEAGDGTTTTAILAAAILREGHKLISAGYDPNQIVRGIRKTADQIIPVLQKTAIPVTDERHLRQVALVSCNGDEEVADALTEACMAVGKDGTVVIEPSERREISVLFKEGVEYPSGPASTSFLGTGTERVLKDPLVAVIVGILSSAQDVVPVLEEASQFPNNELIIIADSIEGEALATISMNDRQGVVRCVPFGANGLGLRRRGPMEDLAALAGATLADKNLGSDPRQWQSEWFGSFQQATVGLSKAVFTAHDEAHDGVQARIAMLKDEMATSPHEYDRDKLRERIAKLQGGMCIIKVGGDTEAEVKERRARIEDALGAVQSALRHGVVAGGGTAYLWASTYEALCDHLPDGEKAGGQCLLRALQAPLHKIATNAYKKADGILDRLLNDMQDMGTFDWTGWDAKTDTYRDFRQEPMIIDPAFVATTALQAAVSVATTLLTAEASITPLRK